MRRIWWVLIGFSLGIGWLTLMAGGNIESVPVSRDANEITMRVIEYGTVDVISPTVRYRLVEIRGQKFLFLSSVSADGGVSAIQVIEGSPQ